MSKSANNIQPTLNPYRLLSLPCKFMLAQDKNLPAHLCHYLALIFWSAMLQNMLNDVVTILILQEATEV